MMPLVRAEVFAPEFVPPVPVGRRGELATLAGWLGDPYPTAPRPWAAAVVGPRGSGTSTVARLAARRLAEAIRREHGNVGARTLSVRVRGLRGAHAVASSLLTQLDPGFRGRGFRVVEIAAGLLRRLRRDGRPVIVLLDDLAPGVGDLSDLLRAFLQPARFLPEGEERFDRIWLLLSGVPEAIGTWERSVAFGLPSTNVVQLGLFSAGELRQLVRDRAERALGREPPPELVANVLARVEREGTGAERAVQLLRRELLGPELRPLITPLSAASADAVIEPRVLWALHRAGAHAGVRVRDVRLWEARLAHEEGLLPMPATTLWRRMVQLEAAGILRRRVRPGGVGGTESIVELAEGTEPAPFTPGGPGTRPIVGVLGASHRPWSAAPLLAAPPAPEPPLSGRIRPPDGGAVARPVERAWGNGAPRRSAPTVLGGAPPGRRSRR
jgi:hypothetical protein